MMSSSTSSSREGGRLQERAVGLVAFLYQNKGKRNLLLFMFLIYTSVCNNIILFLPSMCMSFGTSQYYTYFFLNGNKSILSSSYEAKIALCCLLSLF